MTWFQRILVPLLLAVLLAGCSNKPGDSEIRRQISEQQYRLYGEPIVEVVNFSRVNGIPRDENTYIAEVEYDLRFKVDLTKAGEALQSGGEGGFSAGVKVAALGLTFGDFKAGDLKHKQERVRFVRSEKGWMIDPSEK